MDFLEFFQGRLRGKGCVRGLTGRILRRFTAEYEGVWSEPHKSLHLDETVRYGDGAVVTRHWAARAEAGGIIVAHDAVQHGRMRVYTAGGRTRLRFDRPRTAPAPTSLHVVFDLEEVSADEVRMHGRTRVLGLTVTRTEFTLRREP
jgi:hypothetical protein